MTASIPTRRSPLLASAANPTKVGPEAGQIPGQRQECNIAVPPVGSTWQLYHGTGPRSHRESAQGAAYQAQTD